MNDQHKNTSFRPWLGNLIWVVYGFAALWLAYHFMFERGLTQEFMVTATVLVFLIIWQWRTFGKRFHGQRVEAKALKELAKAIKSFKDCQLETCVPLKAGGDADALVIFPTRKFNIEIKSVTDAKQVTSKHAGQAMTAARALFSTPVIWLPSATTLQFSEKNNVQIVGSDAKEFLRFLVSIK